MKSSIFNSNKTFIVAEIGNNHEGSFKIASEMIEAASNAGVDAVKFQTINPNNFVTSTDLNRIRQLSKFKLSNEEFIKLANQANDLGILFFSTPFDLESAKFLNIFSLYSKFPLEITILCNLLILYLILINLQLSPQEFQK